MTGQPKRIAITGAAGNIAYQAMFRIAAGEFLGDQQLVALNLIDIPPAIPSLGGTAMELEGCAFPLFKNISIPPNIPPTTIVLQSPMSPCPFPHSTLRN